MAERQPVIFIAGPYRARSLDQIKANVRAAAHWGARVKQKGWTPLCPQTNFHAICLELMGECGPCDPSWQRDEFALLERCDGVLMIPHWMESDDARAARQFAVAHDIMVFEHTYWDKPPAHGGIPPADQFWDLQREMLLKRKASTSPPNPVSTYAEIAAENEKEGPKHKWDPEVPPAMTEAGASELPPISPDAEKRAWE